MDDHLIVTLVDGEADTGELSFNLVAPYAHVNENITVSLNYWRAQMNWNTWSLPSKWWYDSDAFVFSPERYQKVAWPYTKLKSHTKIGNDTFVFHFEKLDDEDQKSNQAIMTVKVQSIDFGFVGLRFDVDLLGAPNIPYGGHEIVMEFKIDNFDNNGTFYTDSNGLEMQKRVLNYRPTWDINRNYDESYDNITANFYPVTSAITIKDPWQNKTFTVMNDRAQAGSSLSPYSIQLMQNRRTFGVL